MRNETRTELQIGELKRRDEFEGVVVHSDNIKSIFKKI